MKDGREIYRQKEDRVNLAVGRAINRWANLEFSILRLFSISAGVDINRSAVIFQNVRSFSQALEIASSVVELRVGDGRRKIYWRSLKKYIAELSRYRNTIAHTGLVAHGNGHPDTLDWSEVEPRIGPSTTSWFAGRSKISLGADDIFEFVHDFQHALEAVEEFSRVVEGGSQSTGDLPATVPHRREIPDYNMR